MRGYEGVGRALAEALGGRVPARLVLLESELGVIDGDPQCSPALVAWTQLPIDQVGYDDWPFLLVVVQDSPGLRRYDMTDAGNVYEKRYNARVFVWARGDGFEQVASVRSRLMLAVLEVLLADPQVAAGITVDEASITERYSDVSSDEEMGASIAAGYLQLALTAVETLFVADPAGSAAVPAVAAGLLPGGAAPARGPDTPHPLLIPHPAFD